MSKKVGIFLLMLCAGALVYEVSKRPELKEKEHNDEEDLNKWDDEIAYDFDCGM